MKTNIYIDGTDARAAFGVWVVRGGGPAGPGGLCRGWEVCRVPVCRGEPCIRPHETRPVGPNKYVRHPSLSGRLWGVCCCAPTRIP